MTGTEARKSSASITPASPSGPAEQLAPMASARSPSSSAAIASGGVPESSRPSAPYALETNTGRSLFSLAASSAAFVSYPSLMVSIKMKSAPCAAPRRTSAAKARTASSKSRSPNGRSIRPVGPRSSATNFACPPPLDARAWCALASAAATMAASSSAS